MEYSVSQNSQRRTTWGKHFQALLICKKRSVLFPVLSICRVRDALYLLLVRCLWLAARALRYRTWWRTCCLEEEKYVSTEILLTVNWILICKQQSYFQALDLQCILKNIGLKWFCKRTHISRVKKCEFNVNFKKEEVIVSSNITHPHVFPDLYPFIQLLPY